MVDNTDADYMHTKRVFSDLEIKNIGEYHDFGCSMLAGQRPMKSLSSVPLSLPVCLSLCH